MAKCKQTCQQKMREFLIASNPSPLPHILIVSFERCSLEHCANA